MNTLDINEEKETLLLEAEFLLRETHCHASDILSFLIQENLKKIKDFRLKLAYNRATEALEGKLGWTAEFQDINTRLEARLKEVEDKTDI